MVEIMIVELKELKELMDLGKIQNHPQSHSFEVGKKYLIRTVTYHHVGKLISITDTDLMLESASWIADSGRFHTALKTGNLFEVEPFVNPVIINRSAVIDAALWDFDLPMEQK
jgi:hypothetical protein